MEFTGTEPLGLAAGIWGLLASTILFIGVSLVTRAPEQKAREFLEGVKSELHHNNKGSYRKHVS